MGNFLDDAGGESMPFNAREKALRARTLLMKTRSKLRAKAAAARRSVLRARKALLA